MVLNADGNVHRSQLSIQVGGLAVDWNILTVILHVGDSGRLELVDITPCQTLRVLEGRNWVGLETGSHGEDSKYTMGGDGIEIVGGCEWG